MKMSLWKESQKNAKIGRNEDCFEEHVMGDNRSDCCSRCTCSQSFPKDGQINLHQKSKVNQKRTRKER